MMTASKPKKAAARKRAIELTRTMLVAAFPKCFSPKRAAKVPLALCLHNEILAALPEIGFRRLMEALGDYTSGPTYLRNVLEGTPRVGLQGDFKGKVTAAEAAHAAGRLAAFSAWADASKPKGAEEARDERLHAELVELDEIASGAWGDGPAKRGAARDRAADLRKGTEQCSG
jgi:sRNA-binding protein